MKNNNKQVSLALSILWVICIWWLFRPGEYKNYLRGESTWEEWNAIHKVAPHVYDTFLSDVDGLYGRLVICPETHPSSQVFTTQSFNLLNKEEKELHDILTHAKAVFGLEYCSCTDPALALVQNKMLSSSANPQYAVALDLERLLLQRNATIQWYMPSMWDSFQKKWSERDARFDEILTHVQSYLWWTFAQRQKKIKNNGWLAERARDYSYKKSWWSYSYFDVLDIFWETLEDSLIQKYWRDGIHPFGSSNLVAQNYDPNLAIWENYTIFWLQWFETADSSLYTWKMNPIINNPDGTVSWWWIDNIDNYWNENRMRNEFNSPFYTWDIFEEYLTENGLWQNKSTWELKVWFLMNLASDPMKIQELQRIKENFMCSLFDKKLSADSSWISSWVKKYSMFDLQKWDYYCPQSTYRNSYNWSPVVENPVPVVENPAPVVEQPAPIVKQPAPVVKQPAPIIVKPVPIVDEPVNTKWPIFNTLPPSTYNPYTSKNIQKPSLSPNPTSTNPYLDYVSN